MTRRSDGEAVRVTLACGCKFERDESIPGHYMSKYVVACDLADTPEHGFVRIDWTRVAAAYCMALSESKPA